MSTTIKFIQQENESGDQALATQGFGRVSETPAPTFNPTTEIDDAISLFSEHGFAVLRGCLSENELAHLMNFLTEPSKSDQMPGVWEKSASLTTEIKG